MMKELCPNCDNYSKCNRSYRDDAGYCDGFLNHKRMTPLEHYVKEWLKRNKDDMLQRFKR